MFVLKTLSHVKLSILMSTRSPLQNVKKPARRFLLNVSKKDPEI